MVIAPAKSLVAQKHTLLLKEIIHGCRKRDRRSQKKLYKKFYGYGMSITLRYADSRDEAAEILNDAFMKVFTNIEKYDDNREFKPWFRRIVINTAINRYHQTKQERTLEELSLVKETAGRQETITSSLSYQEIIEMIQQLSPAYRAVFNLYVIEGFKHREIAEILDIKVGTSKSNLAKAKQNLQSILEKNLI